MTPLLTLMSLAGEKPLTNPSLAYGYLIRALPPLLPKQRHDLPPPAGTVLDPRWLSLTRLTGALVAHLLALVLPAVEGLHAGVLAEERLLAPALRRSLLFPAEAGEGHVEGARGTGAWVAGELARVEMAVEWLVTGGAVTGEGTARG